jgi:antitoxin component of MazEF toxin-antitoxin module
MGRLVGRAKSYLTSVHKSGRVHIGETYINELNLDTGDELSITVLADGFLLKIVNKKSPAD